MSDPAPASSPARAHRSGAALRGALAVAAALVVSLPLLAGVTGHGSAASACGTGEQLMRPSSGVVACAHVDEAPPGVDVTAPVSTGELRARTGGGKLAYAAAEDLGVPTAAAVNATSPAVTCDGDGTNGYRVQPMYVVESDKPNRYASLLPSFKLWAAGTDDVVNRSAALTGGVRNLRYVTEAGPGSTCEAKVLNVTVPPGSMSSFNATISAVQALGYSDPARKYLMWTDASTLCGVALVYLNDNPAQSNSNNGGAPQWARVDSGCWGLGNINGQHSVEAHELVHTLGAVSRSAVHSTPNGHCWDESDTMCYSDGAGAHPMVQVCPSEREYLLDCGSDDYFSTYPDPGSYLDTHWNAANSRFLVGGGDGSGGGTAGSPTTLGATIGVNNPAVPGLVTQVTVSPAVPTGRTVTSIAWTSLRRDCVFADPSAEQTTVSCPANASAATKVTALVTDSTGATKSVTSALTFATKTARAITLTAGVDGQSGSTASVCSSATFPVTASAVDQATGLPIRGLTVTFTRQTAAMAVPVASGSGPSQLDGVASTTSTAPVTTTYAAKTTAGTVYAAGASASVTATSAACTVGLSATSDTGDLYYGDPVTVTGRLTRALSGDTVGVGGVSVPIKLTWTENGLAKSQTLLTTKSVASGGFSVVVRPTRSGSLSATLPASKAWPAVTVDLGAVTVRVPTTDLTATADRTAGGYGSTARLTGRLTRTGATTTGVAGAPILVKLVATGSTTARVIGTGRTLADGTYAVSLPLKASGAMSVVYAGAAGMPAESVSIGAVTVGDWTPALTLAGSPAGTAYNLSGTVTRTYGGTTESGATVPVRVYFTPTSTGVPAVVGSLTTKADGTFAMKVLPRAAGSYTARVAKLTGYAEASSSAYPVS